MCHIDQILLPFAARICQSLIFWQFWCFSVSDEICNPIELADHICWTWPINWPYLYTANLTQSYTILPINWPYPYTANLTQLEGLYASQQHICLPCISLNMLWKSSVGPQKCHIAVNADNLSISIFDLWCIGLKYLPSSQYLPLTSM